MQPNVINPSQLLMGFLDKEQRRISQDILTSQFSQELTMQQNNLTTSADASAAATPFLGERATEDKNQNANSSDTGAVSQPAVPPTTTSLVAAEKALNNDATSLARSVGNQSARVKEALAFNDSATIGRVLASLDLPAESRKACLNAQDSQGRISLEALVNVLNNASTSPSNLAQSRVSAQDVRELFDSISIKNASATANAIPSLTLKQAGSYSLSEFRQLIDKAIRQVPATDAKSSASSSKSSKNATSSSSAASSLDKDSQQDTTPVQPQCLPSSMIPPFVHEDSPDDKKKKFGSTSAAPAAGDKASNSSKGSQPTVDEPANGVQVQTQANDATAAASDRLRIPAQRPAIPASSETKLNRSDAQQRVSQTASEPRVQFYDLPTAAPFMGDTVRQSAAASLGEAVQQTSKVDLNPLAASTQQALTGHLKAAGNAPSKDSATGKPASDSPLRSVGTELQGSAGTTSIAPAPKTDASSLEYDQSAQKGLNTAWSPAAKAQQIKAAEGVFVQSVPAGQPLATADPSSAAEVKVEALLDAPLIREDLGLKGRVFAELRRNADPAAETPSVAVDRIPEGKSELPHGSVSGATSLEGAGNSSPTARMTKTNGGASEWKPSASADAALGTTESVDGPLSRALKAGYSAKNEPAGNAGAGIIADEVTAFDETASSELTPRPGRQVSVQGTDRRATGSANLDAASIIDTRTSDGYRSSLEPTPGLTRQVSVQGTDRRATGSANLDAASIIDTRTSDGYRSSLEPTPGLTRQVSVQGADRRATGSANLDAANIIDTRPGDGYHSSLEPTPGAAREISALGSDSGSTGSRQTSDLDAGANPFRKITAASFENAKAAVSATERSQATSQQGKASSANTDSQPTVAVNGAPIPSLAEESGSRGITSIPDLEVTGRAGNHGTLNSVPTSLSEASSGASRRIPNASVGSVSFENAAAGLAAAKANVSPSAILSFGQIGTRDGALIQSLRSPSSEDSQSTGQSDARPQTGQNRSFGISSVVNGGFPHTDGDYSTFNSIPGNRLETNSGAPTPRPDIATHFQATTQQWLDGGATPAVSSPSTPLQGAPAAAPIAAVQSLSPATGMQPAAGTTGTPAAEMIRSDSGDSRSNTAVTHSSNEPALSMPADSKGQQPSQTSKESLSQDQGNSKEAFSAGPVGGDAKPAGFQSLDASGQPVNALTGAQQVDFSGQTSATVSASGRLSLGETSWPQDLSQRIEELSRQKKTSQLTLELDPKGMGHLTLRVGAKKEEVTAWVSTDNDQVRQTLLRNAPALRQHLESQGLVLSNLFVDVRQQKDNSRNGAFQESFVKEGKESTVKIREKKGSESSSAYPAYAARSADRLISLFA